MPTDTTHANERLATSAPEERTIKKNSSKGNPLFRMVLTLLWAIFHFAFFFIQQIAEIFAPILLVAGFVWKTIPNLAFIAGYALHTSDKDFNDIIEKIIDMPQSLIVANHTISSSSLIFDGFLLIALSALCATVTAFLGRRL